MLNTDYGFTSKYYDRNEDNMINRKCAPTAYAKMQGTRTTGKYTTADGEEACYWWLRSPGLEVGFAVFVGDYGVVYDYGYDGSCGIRPALIINLE